RRAGLAQGVAGGLHRAPPLGGHLRLGPPVRELLGRRLRERAGLREGGRQRADALVGGVFVRGVPALLLLERLALDREAGRLAAQRAVLLGERRALAAHPVALREALLEAAGEGALGRARLAFGLTEGRKAGLRRPADGLQVLDALLRARLR